MNGPEGYRQNRLPLDNLWIFSDISGNARAATAPQTTAMDQSERSTKAVQRMIGRKTLFASTQALR